MGLDVVELVMAVEECFAIEIGDEEATKIETVGQLFDLVVAKTGAVPQASCASSARFYRLRRAMMQTTGSARRDVVPQAPLEKLLPRLQRAALWRRFQENLELPLPPLRRSPRLVSALQCGALLLLALSAVPMAAYGFQVTLWLGANALVWCVAYRLTRPLAVELPRECSTVGELVRVSLRDNLVDSVQPERKSARAMCGARYAKLSRANAAAQWKKFAPKCIWSAICISTEKQKTPLASTRGRRFGVAKKRYDSEVYSGKAPPISGRAQSRNASVTLVPVAFKCSSASTRGASETCESCADPSIVR